MEYILNKILTYYGEFKKLYFSLSNIKTMSGFNKVTWDIGKKIEDELLPKINSAFGGNFKRSDDIYDILDFKDDIQKTIVEVKGRRINSTQFDTTIITCGKLTEALMKIEVGYDVYFFFVFNDKTLYIKVDKDDCDWVVKLTGTNHIPHYLIPIKTLKVFDEVNFKP
jgi:hypothetical protein